MYDIELAKAAEKAVLADGHKRVILFSFKGKEYYIKQCLSNHRNRFAKQGTHLSYLTELTKIQLVNERLPIAPTIALMEETYFVMESCGQPLQRLASQNPELATKAFTKAGLALGNLHSFGLHHGRPALRDICYDAETDKVTLLDWENEMTFFSVDKRVLDLFLFIHGYMREGWSTLTLLDDAMTAYISTSDESWRIVQGVYSFIKDHSCIFSICHTLAQFGWVDIVAVDKTKEYIENVISHRTS